MTAQIIQFPTNRLTTTRQPTVVEGEVVAETPVSAIPAGPCKAPLKRAQRGGGKRSKMRVEKLAALCDITPKKHRDMRRHPGVLVIDWKGDVPYTMTFDPSDESVPNIVAPIVRFERSDETISVRSNEGVWVFSSLPADVVEAE